MIQTFSLLGIPKAQGRPKFFRRGDRVGTYDPKESRQYKDNVAAQIAAQNPVLMQRGTALLLSVKFYLSRPLGHYGKNGVKPSAPRYHTTKPDLDNMLKAIKDALKGVVWIDDSQVINVYAQKNYREVPGVDIAVEDI